MKSPDRILSTQTTRLHKMLWTQSLLLCCAICCAMTLVSSAIAQPATPVRPLPPFVVDPELPTDIVVNPGQGLGQCHWLDSAILSLPYVSWAYDAGQAASGWATIQPEENTFNWEPLDAQIAKASGMGKRIWLELLTTEGQTPQWAIDAGTEIVGSRGGAPVPWNETYQRLLRKAVHAMAARYDNNPAVDAINIMAGGTYGEMSFPYSDTAAWERSGYTNEIFIETVKQIIDIYLEDEYEWEDGSLTRGFQRTPIVLQLGAGLYGHTAIVIRPVVEYAMERYGMRVWLKYNGFGSGHDMGWVYEQYNTLTRVGYEPGGNSPDFLSRPKEYIRAAVLQHASYLCLQSPYFDITDPKWQEAREFAAQYLGTHIVSQGVDAPGTVIAGQEYVFTTAWMNRGTVPLMRPQREGTRAVPASYDILIAFIDTSSGVPAFQHSLAPSIPTTEWYSAQPIAIKATVAIPGSVPTGDYDLRIALVNPLQSPYDGRHHFRLLNADLHDGTGRYTVGRIAVQNQATPTATSVPPPTLTPTPSNGGETDENWLSELLQTIWEWLRSLLG